MASPSFNINRFECKNCEKKTFERKRPRVRTFVEVSRTVTWLTSRKGKNKSTLTLLNVIKNEETVVNKNII